MHRQFDSIVLGSGIAGLSFALQAARHGSVAVLAKRARSETNTAYAQGGIAAVFAPGDSFEQHIRDTLVAGGGLCREDAVRVTVTEGPARVRELIDLGAEFTRDATPFGYHLTREGGHSQRRVVHAADLTGHEVERTLLGAAAQAGVQFFEEQHAIDLIMSSKVHSAAPDRALGAYALNLRTGEVDAFVARVVVLATGGAGKVYLYTTNPDVATGDGFAIAHRADAKLSDMEFVQFHPTALDTPENPLALISEAVRGEGAILVNAAGERFMVKRHKLAELAPRDVVARAIFAEQRGGKKVYLDARKIGRNFAKRFPGILALCQARGIDPRKDLIPVTPAAHYMMGGIVTDLAGRSSVPRLYACGEVARTGVHGANRLASNSLLEGLVFAERVARDMQLMTPLPSVPAKGDWTVPILSDRGAAQVAAGQIRTVMWEHAGISRTANGLRECLLRLDAIEDRLPEGATEERNMVQTARLIAEAALMRKESRGGHYRSDFPRARSAWRGKHIEW
jgi:L-aspartate oxidase